MKVQKANSRKCLLVFYLRENIQGMKESYHKLLLMYVIIVKYYHKTQLKKNPLQLKCSEKAQNKTNDQLISL